MSPRPYRFGLLLACLLASEVWALGLGEVRLDSALNEPLQAEIELLSPTQEELDNLRINLASSETFERYGIDRPVFLTRLNFDVAGSGANAVVRVTSQEPITEPFVTFLIEAVWSRGRLLREYTVLLDPPTFAPPPSRPTTEAVTAPRQTPQTDRGTIEQPAAPAPTPAPARPAPRQAPAPTPAPAPAPSTTPAPAPVATDFDTSSGGDYQVRRGDTLWRIAEEVRPDARLTMNQTMLAIYEANPNAFAGNINRLRANARLSIPSADEIFRISRGTALSEIRRQNQTWRGEAPSPPATSQPSLTLVPPDTEQTPYEGRATTDTDTAPAAATDRGNEDRIRQLEERVAEQQSLLEIRDSELARLRSELQRLREERAAGAVTGDDAPVPAETPGDDVFVEDEVAADAAADTQAAPAVETQPPAPRITTAPARDEGIVGTITGFLTSIWGLIGIGLLAVLGVLLWFARRASGKSVDAEDTGTWEALGADDDADAESVASTQRLRALARDDETAIVVVEQPGGDTISSDKDELTAGLDEPLGEPPAAPTPAPDIDDTAEPVSLEDTFSSETAINLDQTDPIAEADFHMAYGLYDQAADLITGALSVEPERTDLMAKLCEIYFVWGNRESFVTAAGNLKAALGDDSSREWDKIVIMGQQIASDDPLFADVTPGVGGAAAVDLDFVGEDDDAGGLDIDFAGEELGEEVDSDSSIIIDLGAEESMDAAATGIEDVLDFPFDEEPATDAAASATREMPQDLDETAESPTIEQVGPGQNLDSTTELPVARDDIEAKLSELREGEASDATAEIDLDDLGLDLGALGAELDNPNDDEDTAAGDDLRDATGLTQILPDEESVPDEGEVGDDDATAMGPGLAAEGRPDFDFAATEALSSDALEGDEGALEPTTETARLASTEMELDINDLTAALKLSDAGDTIEQRRDDDATVEQPLTPDYDKTQEIGPAGVSSELQEARTMTEVGTKLDLARAYVDMGDPGGARNILEEVLEEGDEAQRQEARQLLDSLPS